jgi:hypothetical protein
MASTESSLHLATDLIRHFPDTEVVGRDLPSLGVPRQRNSITADFADSQNGKMLAPLGAHRCSRGAGPHRRCPSCSLELLRALAILEPSAGYLKRLPDFDDAEAEKKALDYAQQSRSLLQALAFLVSWPALDRAAEGLRPH